MGELRDKMKLELDIIGHDPKTKKKYIKCMEDFLKYFKDRDPIDLGVDEIKIYQQYLLNTCLNAPRTVNAKVSGIRFFYTRVLKMWWISEEVGRVKAPTFIPTILSENEVAKMIDGTDCLLHKAIVMMLYSTGMRQAELRALEVTDIDKERDIINIRQGKCKKDRQVFLSPLVYDILRSYWVVHRFKRAIKSDYLFVPKKNSYKGKIIKQLSHSALGYIVDKAAERAGIKKKLPHIACAIHFPSIYSNAM